MCADGSKTRSQVRLGATGAVVDMRYRSAMVTLDTLRSLHEP
jgi:hypothetical protein